MNDWILHPKISEFGFYTLKFQNLDFTPWSLGVFGFYTMMFQNLDFSSYILGVFGFYSLKFGGIWILHSKVS